MPSEAGLYEDARAYMRLASGRGGPPPVAWGESLGTGVATLSASEFPVSGLVLDAPYASVAEVAQGAFPLAPASLLIRHPFDSIARMPAVTAPTLVLHGEADTLIPPRHGRRMLAAAGGPSRGLFLPGVGHTALDGDPSGRATGAALDFLADLPAPGPIVPGVGPL